jgi:hypothetical protein
VSFNNAWALPNKFFDYIQARLGIIIGPSPEMVQTLEKYRLGATSSGFEADDIVATLDALSPTVVAAWKQNSHEAASELSAEKQVAVWDRAIAAMVQHKPNPRRP